MYSLVYDIGTTRGVRRYLFSCGQTVGTVRLCIYSVTLKTRIFANESKYYVWTFPSKGGDRALFQACTASGLGFWNRAYDYAQDVPKEHDT